MNKVILILIAVMFVSLSFSPCSAIDTKYDNETEYIDTFFGGQPFRGIVQGTDQTGAVRQAIIDPKKTEPTQPTTKKIDKD